MSKQESNQSFSESTDNINDICQSYTPKAKVVKKQTVDVDSGNANTATLLKRVNFFLEDGDWNRADEYCEKVLDIDPENAEAYVGKLMAELQVHCREDLQNQAYPFAESNNYKKAVRFGNENLKAELSGYITHIVKNNKNEIYDNAVSTMNSANTEEEYKYAAKIFKKISGWKDTDEKLQLCNQKIEEIKAKEEAERLVVEQKAEQERSAKAKKRKKFLIIASAAVAVCVAFVIVLNTVIIPDLKYNNALELYNAGKYDEAITAFEALNGYKDSKSQITKSETAIKDGKYSAAVELCDAGKYFEAITAFTALNGYKDSANKAAECRFLKQKAELTNVTVGSTIWFGFYEQDNDTSNGKEEIKWKVLAVERNKALVISQYALDCQQYNSPVSEVTWEKCTLRTWLNGTFYNAAFGSDHQKMIASSTVTADNNPEYSTSPGNNTTDKVFLLSVTEAIKYLGSDAKCQGTAYCYAQGAYKNSNSICWWWLRSPGCNSYFASGVVTHHGDYLGIDNLLSTNSYAVRPAMWINIGS